MPQLKREGLRYPCMMHLTTRGTYYDVGYNVGQTFSDRIKLFFAESDNIQDKLLPFYDSRAGRDYYEESVRVCQDCFPQYVCEVRGMADGAGLAFEHVFMANVFERVLEPQDKNEAGDAASAAHNTSSAAADTPGRPADEFGCTTLFVNSTQNQLLLHNEDSGQLVKQCGYLVTADIVEEGWEREQFTSFCYPACLPGRAFNTNQHGLAFSSNALYPAKVLEGTPSRVFTLRSLLRARDVSDVIRLAKNAPHGVAYGFTVNVSTRDGQMTSVEVGPGKPEGRVHVYDVSHKGKKPQAPCHYYHFNAYKHLDVEEMPKLFSSSRRRERTQALPPPENLHSGLAVLADTEDQQAPVFRTPRPSDLLETVCTAVFDVTGRQMGVYQGRDNLLENRPVFKFPIP